jgi:2-C-methyl-D-erythritol 4-phosphate cytidylyltransferase
VSEAELPRASHAGRSLWVSVLIPAGGSGTRVGGRTPKQFLPLGRRSILEATLARFAERPARVDEIVIAAPAAHLGRTRRLVARTDRRPPPVVVPGGDSRQESVWRALERVERRSGASVHVVAVHDAVRPFVTGPLIAGVVAAAVAHGAAVCAVPIAETVKRVEDGFVDTTVDRTGLWAVQTPQAFHWELLREAHEKARREGIVGTDDAMLVERLGHRVRVVPGIAENVKITTREDVRRARARSR